KLFWWFAKARFIFRERSLTNPQGLRKLRLRKSSRIARECHHMMVKPVHRGTPSPLSLIKGDAVWLRLPTNARRASAPRLVLLLRTTWYDDPLDALLAFARIRYRFRRANIPP